MVAGDVYVNHGIVQAAMRARGHYRLRMLRNPLHLFTTTRDRLATRGRAHIASSSTSSVPRRHCCERATRDSRSRRWSSATGSTSNASVPRPRRRERPRGPPSGVAADERVVLFIGNEFGRKGLPLLLEAMVGLDPSSAPRTSSVATPDLIAQASSAAAASGLAGRVHFAGPHTDPRPWLRAADVLAMPSSYESFGLVVLEALACGVPVVATPTGCVPDLVVDGVNGAVVEATPGALAAWPGSGARR